MTKTELYRQAEMFLLEYEGMHRMRNTPERRLILKLIAGHHGMFTAADVVKWVQPHFISQATVYNTLIILEKARLVHCLHRQHGGRVMEYEFTLGDRSAICIVCSKCGRVIQVQDKVIENSLNRRIYPNFIMHRFSTYVFGECKKCPQKAKTTMKV